MTDLVKFRIVLHLVSSGMELAISVRGQDALEQACNYLKELLGGGTSRSINGEHHFVVDDIQLESFQKFLRKLHAE